MTPYDTSWTGKKDVILRDYTNIYATRNVDDPIGDSIKLGYISNIDDIKFQVDDFTYFHFPLKKVADDETRNDDEIITSADISSSYQIRENDGETNRFCEISETTLVNDGATYGSAPYKADRIYKMKYDYENTSPYGRAQPESSNNGKWLCSWLSGDVLDKTSMPVWMDRWFDPSRISESDAILYTNSDENDTMMYSVYDRPSEMSFDFGSYYRYWRVGNKTINDIVDKIGIGGSLKIQHPAENSTWLNEIKSFDIKDRIIYTNIDDSSLNNYRVSNDFADSKYAITFNGVNQYAAIPYDDEIGHVAKDQYSICFWVKNDSWKNSTSYSIVDNMYDGGWKFAVTNRSDNLFIYLFGNDDKNPLQDGTSCLFNLNGDLVSNKTYWKNDELNGYKSNIKDMLIDIDSYCFVLDYDADHEISYIRKIDYFGNQLGVVKIEAALQYLDISNENHDYVLYAYNVKDSIVSVYEINRYTLTYKKLNNQDADDTEVPTHPPCEDPDESPNPLIEVSIRVIPNTGIVKIREEYFTYLKNKAVVVDNGNDTVDGVWLDKKQKLKYHSFSTEDVKSISVDYDNNIWVLRGNIVEKYSVVYHTYRLIKTFKIKKDLDIVTFDFLSKNVNGENVDYMLFVSSEKQRIYVYTTDGELVDSYDSSKFYVKPSNKRYCTAYDWYRRNRYLTNCIYFDVFDSVGHKRVRKSLDECSDKEWHLVAATVGNYDGEYFEKFYFDCKCVSKKRIYPTLKRDGSIDYSTTYKFDSSIIIGGVCGKIHPMMDEINIANGSFACSIDDLRIYERAIDAEDLYYIYMSKYKCEDLIWHLKSENKNYVENIEKFYKFKMPGSKSAQYVLRIKGYKNKNGELNEELKSKLENMIYKSFKKVTPAYTSLLKIIWE